MAKTKEEVEKEIGELSEKMVTFTDAKEAKDFYKDELANIITEANISADQIKGIYPIEVTQNGEDVIISFDGTTSGSNSENYYSTSSVLSGNIITFNRTDLNDAYSVDLTPALNNIITEDIHVVAVNFTPNDLVLTLSGTHGTLTTTIDEFNSLVVNDGLQVYGAQGVTADTYYGDGSNLTGIDAGTNTNLANTDLTFNAPHTADLSGHSWTIKNGVNSLFDINSDGNIGLNGDLNTGSALVIKNPNNETYLTRWYNQAGAVVSNMYLNGQFELYANGVGSPIHSFLFQSGQTWYQQKNSSGTLINYIHTNGSYFNTSVILGATTKLLSEDISLQGKTLISDEFVQHISTTATVSGNLINDSLSFHMDGTKIEGQYKDNLGLVTPLSIGDNIANKDLVFDGDHTADLNGSTWTAFENTNGRIALKLGEIQTGVATDGQFQSQNNSPNFKFIQSFANAATKNSPASMWMGYGSTSVPTLYGKNNLTLAATSLQIMLEASAQRIGFNVGTTRFATFDNNGDSWINAIGRDFGVGLTNPTAKLHVKGSGGLEVFIVEGSGGLDYLVQQEDGFLRQYAKTINIADLDLDNNQFAFHIDGTKLAGQYKDNVGLVTPLSIGDNISNSDLVFDGSYTTDILDNNWTIFNSLNSNKDIFKIDTTGTRDKAVFGHAGTPLPGTSLVHHVIGYGGRSTATSTSSEFVFEESTGSALQLLSNVGKINSFEFKDGASRHFIEASAGTMRFYHGGYWMLSKTNSHTVYGKNSANDSKTFKTGSNVHIFEDGDVQLWVDDVTVNGNVNNPRNLNFRTAYKTAGGVANSNNIRLTSTTDNVGNYDLIIKDDADVELLKVMNNGDLYTNGIQGLSETVTFGGGSSGDVATLTYTNGLVTGKTLVP